MSFPVPVTSTADHKATATGAAVLFDAVMAAPEFWAYTSSTDSYIAQGAAPVAAAADGSTFVPAGETVLVDAALGAKLSAIAVTTAGVATLTKVRFAR